MFVAGKHEPLAHKYMSKCILKGYFNQLYLFPLTQNAMSPTKQSQRDLARLEDVLIAQYEGADSGSWITDFKKPKNIHKKSCHGYYGVTPSNQLSLLCFN